jgi:hypothetical protein
MKNKYIFCQSCGMPIAMVGPGTNDDSTRSAMYCSVCYTKGKFNNPSVNTPKKMQYFVINLVKKKGYPGFIGWIFTRNIRNLYRWKNNLTN